MMLVRRFLDRLSEGAPTERAEIVEALVRVYLEVPLDAETRAAAVTAMTLILDDPAPRVRRSMALNLADTPEAPRAVVLALADDQADIAEIVLSRSPVLGERDLIDIVGGTGERQRTAVAGRSVVTVGVAAAIVEVADPEACLTLVTNPGAQIAACTFRRLVERHRKDATVRGALLDREDLPITLRHELIDGLSEALRDLIRLRRWLPIDRADRVLDEARQRAVINLASSTQGERLRPYIERLASEQRLTPPLIIRAACWGNIQFFEQALSVLSGMPLRRVASLIHDRQGSGFPALFRRTGLADTSRPAFRAVVQALNEVGCGSGGASPTRSRMIEHVLARYQSYRGSNADELFVLLSRLASEARREEARAEVGGYFGPARAA